MSTGQKVNFRVICQTAHSIVEHLKPFCTKIEIAGSIRRLKSYCSDIEICCIPKTESIQDGLFDTKIVRVDGFVKAVNKWEKIKGDPVEGKYTQRVHESGVNIDIFMNCAENWGLQLLMRTGPAGYSKEIIGERIKRYGYYCKDGFIHSSNGAVVPVYDEIDVFKLMNLQFIEPYARL